MNSQFHCHNESRFVRRHNNLLDTSKPTNVSSKDVNEIYSREEAPADFTHDSSVELSSEDPNFGPLKYNSGGGPEDYSLLGIDVANYFCGLVDDPTQDNLTIEALMGLVNSTIWPDNNDHEMLAVNPVASGSVHEIENHPSEPIAATTNTGGQTHVNLADVALMAGNPIETMGELVYMRNRGTQRRCLDFEMASVQRNIDNSGDGSNINSNTTKSDERDVGNEMSLLPRRYTCDSQMCVLLGIGSHMNPLATFNANINNEMMMSSGWKSTLPSFTSSLHQECRLSRVPASIERDLVPSENKVQPTEDCPQSAGCMAAEDFHQNNPKKRRHKSEPAREGEACQRCNCRKSKCLKLYCECFSAGVYCTEPCCCQDCFNKSINDDVIHKTRKQIESRNPFAFTPKVIRSSDSLAEIGDDPTKTPASARHRRGCNCKKSSCLKRYCECFQGGVGCSINCRCEGCKNEYGRKDVSAPAEIKAVSEEAEACEKGRVEKASQKTEIQNIEGHPDCALPTRPSRQLPFSSKGKPPRSFVDTISGSGLLASQRLENLGSQSKSEKLFQTVPDDDFPVTSITTSSPNSKRICTPKRNVGSSPTS